MKRPENLSGLAAYKKLSPAARRNTNSPTLGKLTPRRPRARDIGRLVDQTLSKLFFCWVFPNAPPWRPTTQAATAMRQSSRFCHQDLGSASQSLYFESMQRLARFSASTSSDEESLPATRSLAGPTRSLGSP